jgi:hypothetical protein
MLGDIMDIKKVKQYAEELELLLEHYSKIDNDASLLYDSLKEIITKAKQQIIKKPLEYSEIPGSYFFNERNLAKYQDLSKCYSTFKLEVTGGDDEYGELRKLVKSI